MRITRKLSRQHGETIVEVMLSIMILSFTLTTVFLIARRSLQTGQAANERSQAQAIIETQIERLRYLADLNSTDPTKDVYKDNTDYCITENLVVETINPSSPVIPGCFGTFPDDEITVVINLDEDGPDNTADTYDDYTFTLKAEWERVGGNDVSSKEQLIMVYRLPKQSLIAYAPPSSTNPTCDLDSPLPTLGSYTITWIISNATGIVAAGTNMPPGGPTTPTDGSVSLGVLLPGTYNYSLQVTNSGNTPPPCTHTIIVPPAAPSGPPVCTLDGNLLSPGQVRLTWTATNTPTNGQYRVNGGPWTSIGGAKNLSGDYIDLPIAVNSSYGMIFTNGVPSGECTDTVTVPVACTIPPYSVNVISYIQSNGLVNSTYGYDTFDPYFHPAGPQFDRRDIIPDMIVNFPITAGCGYRLTYEAWCRGPLRISPLQPPNTNDCGGTYDQINERARLFMYDGYIGNASNADCTGNMLGYFDTRDLSRGPTNTANSEPVWPDNIDNLTVSAGNVRCIDFVHVCTPGLNPPAVPSPCTVPASVFFHTLTFTQRTIP